MIKAYAGQVINTYCSEAIAEAVSRGADVDCKFNGAEFDVKPNDSVDDAVARWQVVFNENSRKYHESPEGVAATKKQADREIQQKSLAHALVREAGSVRWDDLDCTLRFLERCVEPLGWTYTSHLNAEIVPYMQAAGYKAGAFCGSEFKEDRETFARWLIGQAMDGMESGMGIHQVFGKFYSEWVEKYRDAPSPEDPG